MTKKAVIVISLVEESIEKANEEIEKEILRKFRLAHLRFLGSKELKRSR